MHTKDNSRRNKELAIAGQQPTRVVCVTSRNSRRASSWERCVLLASFELPNSGRQHDTDLRCSSPGAVERWSKAELLFVYLSICTTIGTVLLATQEIDARH